MQVVPIPEQAKQNHNENKLNYQECIGISLVIGLTNQLSTKGIAVEFILFITTADNCIVYHQYIIITTSSACSLTLATLSSHASVPSQNQFC